GSPDSRVPASRPPSRQSAQSAGSPRSGGQQPRPLPARGRRIPPHTLCCPEPAHQRQPPHIASSACQTPCAYPPVLLQLPCPLYDLTIHECGRNMHIDVI